LIRTNYPLLSGIKNEAAGILNASYILQTTDKWFFMFVLTFLIMILGNIITDKLVEPSLKIFNFDNEEISENKSLDKQEKLALNFANAAAVLTVIGILCLVAFPASPLRGEDGGIVGSPFISSIIFIMMLIFLVPGLVYGAMNKT